VVVAWPSMTQSQPDVTGACVSGWRWDAVASRAEVTLRPGAGCDVEVRVP
ncbi:MAG: hypothetical protein QOE92_1628, partial [Chloroflexota bacterium]|nr:hypothetical protein [Chloroflexota bacterium]